MKVLALFPYKKKGDFYNTVLFGSCDEQGNPTEVMCEDGVARILTFGCTHMNSIDKFGLAVGKIYQSGERCYCEGFTGLDPNNKLHGNHVHMDVAEGWHYQREKVGGQWLLPNLTNIANVFFQLKDWNVTRNLNGYTFKEVDSREYQGDVADPEQIILKDGEQVVTFKGKSYTVVKQSEDEDVAIWSLKHPSLAALSKFNTDGVKPNFAKNLSYFVLNGADRGQLNGSEISDIYDEAVPTSQGYIDVVKLKDGTWKFGNFGCDIYRADEAVLRYSTGMVLVAGGVYSNEYSAGVGAGVRTHKDILSCTFVDWSNLAYMVVSNEEVTPDEVREFAMALHMQYAFRDDSGGSGEIVKLGKPIAGAITDERGIPNALVFLPKKKENEPEEPVTPPHDCITQEEHDKLLHEAVDKAVELGKAEAKQLIGELKQNINAEIDKTISKLEGE